MISRRAFIQASTSLSLLGAGGTAMPGFAAESRLRSLTASAKPISAEERRARITKAQELMARQNIVALLIEPGASLEYFTGIEWHRSERTTAAIIPATGRIIVVTPAFEEPSVRETLQVGGEVRPWDEHESPFERIVQGLRDSGAASGIVAAESTMRFFIIAGIRKASDNAYEIVPADALVRACRLIKSPAELALMQLANAVTLEALRIVHAKAVKGMTGQDLGAIVEKATASLGGTPEFSLALLNEASAFPHGSVKRQTVREGSVILMDVGCIVHGYQSDISRSWVFGEPSIKQRTVWQTVKRGQEIALETAKLGTPVGSIDDAVRAFYESKGLGARVSATRIVASYRARHWT